MRAVRRGRFVAAGMTSLRQLLAHAPLLLIDAASARVQAGVFSADGSARWASSTAEANVGVFACLRTLAADPGAMRAFAFCEGPGSILGVRTVAMAVRTWQALAPRPAFAYSSLALAAHALGRRDVSLIADARRDSWHRYRLEEGLRRIPAAELSGELVMPEGFRHWSEPPPRAGSVAYNLAELFPRAGDAALFHETKEPDAFLHEEPSYAAWTPQIHRAPAPP